MSESELFTPKECSSYRRCSVRKLDRERAEGRGPAYVHIDGRIFYRRSDVDRFIAAHVCGGERPVALQTEQPQDHTGDDPSALSEPSRRLRLKSPRHDGARPEPVGDTPEAVT